MWGGWNSCRRVKTVLSPGRLQDRTDLFSVRRTGSRTLWWEHLWTVRKRGERLEHLWSTERGAEPGCWAASPQPESTPARCTSWRRSPAGRSTAEPAEKKPRRHHWNTRLNQQKKKGLNLKHSFYFQHWKKCTFLLLCRCQITVILDHKWFDICINRQSDNPVII